MVLLEVMPNSPAAKAGLEAGDKVLAINGRRLQSHKDWIPFRANLELNRSLQVEVARGSRKILAVLTLTRRAWTYLTLAGRVRLLEWTAAQLLTLIVAFVIAFSRPRDPTALLGAWLLATAAVCDVVPPRGRMAIWRELPISLGILLWVPYLSYTVLGGPITFSFSASFPRRLFRQLWVWLLIWVLPLFFLLKYLMDLHSVIYAPEHTETPVWTLQILNWLTAVGLVGAVAILIVNYRVLRDTNERRRLLVLMLGFAAGVLSLVPFIVVGVPKAVASAFLQSLPVQIASLILFLAVPVFCQRDLATSLV
jgi:membrane-associated protease RseP (regulator of RpoE activity)